MATALIRPLAWDPPHAMGTAPEKTERQKQNKIKMTNFSLIPGVCTEPESGTGVLTPGKETRLLTLLTMSVSHWPNYTPTPGPGRKRHSFSDQLSPV